jgi:hypothetical protein
MSLTSRSLLRWERLRVGTFTVLVSEMLVTPYSPQNSFLFFDVPDHPPLSNNYSDISFSDLTV